MPKKIKTPIDYWSSADWAPKDAPLGDMHKDEGESPSCQFRLPKRFWRIMQELREDPESPYYGMFSTQSDLPRHLVITGLLALAGEFRKIKGKAVALKVREEAVARQSLEESLRTRVTNTIEPVIKTIQGDIESGDVESAAEFLDHFLEKVMELDEREQSAYARGLFAHPAFQNMRKNGLLKSASFLMGAFEDLTKE